MASPGTCSLAMAGPGPGPDSGVWFLLKGRTPARKRAKSQTLVDALVQAPGPGPGPWLLSGSSDTIKELVLDFCPTWTQLRVHAREAAMRPENACRAC